ncbi:PKD repeat protein [Fulvivirga imtechensis AK7]|uniref:PKD repeat protein n=1 Tax=Fulvivirga imtechensis AK7 TaxID=1237149 RepID=L8JVY3_9BACT|nr:gliding motility-associated C-terminal domain-containing protein [Fulvivirga imtechensis]ELR73206.1 PKD repeat protein [Fulvivirga imtechensis AK7]
MFAADIPGGNVYVRDNGFMYIFYDTKALHEKHEGYTDQKDYLPSGHRSEHNPSTENLRQHLFTAEFIGADFSRVTPLEQEATSYNYFHGNDPSRWVSGAKAFNKLLHADIYPEIDMITYSKGYSMKYDLVVREGGDPDQVNIKYEGLEDIYLSEGSLFLTTSVNEVQEYQPYAYQWVDGQKKQVVCEYVLQNNILSYSFPLGYNPCLELVIDPILIFSTYSGSPADNWGNTATYGENGKLYAGGITNHYRGGAFLGEFPATPGAFQTSWGGLWDVAILKYDSSGSELEYATYLGGSGSETPHSMIINSKNELIIFGTTSSADFPITTDAYSDTFSGGTSVTPIGGVPFEDGTDIFIAKLNQSGTKLLSSTFVGGSDNDGINPSESILTKNYGDQQKGEVYIDDVDDIYFVGSTSSNDIFSGSTVSFENQYQGGMTDAMVVKMSGDLTSMIWGGYLGGARSDAGFSLRVTEDKHVIAVGGTESADFPTVAGGIQSVYQGGIDGWICKIAATGDLITNSTFLGTSEYDQAYFVDLNSAGEVYVLGQTKGVYPVIGSVFNNPKSGHFIHKLTSDLSATIFSTVFGEPNIQRPNIALTAFLVNDCNNLYVSGWGSTSGSFLGNNYVALDAADMPTTTDALRQTSNGSDFYLMVLDANATSLLYATYFGGDGSIVHVDGGTSRFDKRGIVYHSVCASCFENTSTFPTTEGAWSQVNGASGGCNNAAFKFDLATLKARLQTNSVAFDQPGLSTICMPDDIVFQNFSIGGEVFEWNFGDGTATTRTDTTYIVHNYKAPGQYKVTLRAIDPNTCTSEDLTSTIVEVVKPNVTVSDDSQLCEGDSFRLEASGGVTYHWVSSDSTVISDERTPEVSPIDTTQYFVTITGAKGCIARDTVTLEVIPKVEVEFDAKKLYDCFSRPPVKLINKSEEGENFRWLLGDGNTSDDDEMIYEYGQDGAYTLTLLGTREFCVFEKRIDLNLVTIKVPNVLTPDGGGHNDVFEIVAGSRVDLKIFNRWGKLVFEDNDYQNTWSGEGDAAGIYYYEADIEGEVLCKGWVHLIK